MLIRHFIRASRRAWRVPEPHVAAVRRFREKLSDAFVQEGCRNSGAISASGTSTKRRSRQARMRHLQFRAANHARAVKQNIEIDGARAVRSDAPPAKLAFDLQERVQQLQRHERSFRFGDGVQEPGLAGRVDGFGNVERGLARTRMPAAFMASTARASVAARSPRFDPSEM